MTVKDLIQFLFQFPEDTIIIEKRYSDLGDMDLSDWELIEAKKKYGDDWYYKMDDWRLDSPYVSYDKYFSELDRTVPVKKYLVYMGN